jgi:phage gp36-like protein
LVYSDLALIKERIRKTDSGDDTYLGHLQVQADAEIDTALKSFTSVPLIVVPEVIKQIACDLTAGIFFENQKGEPQLLAIRARSILERYIRETYFVSSVYEGKMPTIESKGATD